MLWLVVALSCLVVCLSAVMVVRTRQASEHSSGSGPLLPAAPSFDVREGAFDDLARDLLASETLAPQLRFADGRTEAVTPPTSGHGTSDLGRGARGSRRRSGGHIPSSAKESLIVASPSSALALGAVAEAVHDVLAVDSSVLRSLHQLSREQVDGLADLRTLQDSHSYDLTGYKVRGGAGEQQVADHFSEAGHTVTWPGGGPTEFGPSNNPGWDLAVDGHEVNVKVVEDAAQAVSEHFAKYPDVPLVLNADAANTPDDALVFDGTTTFDSAELVGDHVVVIDESLTLSGIEEAQAAVADAAESPVAEGLADQIPVLSFLTAAVRSGYSEGRLLAGGKTDLQRALKNVLIDTAAKGGGATAGGIAGAKTGALVDAALGGTSFGLGAVLGGLIGAVGGAFAGGQAASHIKLAPLREAQAELRRALDDLDGAVATEKDSAESALRVATHRADSDFRRRASTCRRAFEELLDELAARHHAVVSLTPTRVDALAATAEESVNAAVANHALLVSGLHGRQEKAGLSGLRASRAAADRWRARLRAAVSAHRCDQAAGSQVFDVLMASPAGPALARQYLTACAQHSRLLRRTALEGNRQMVRSIRAARADAVTNVQVARRTALGRANDALTPYKSRLSEAHAKTKGELAKAGASQD